MTHSLPFLPVYQTESSQDQDVFRGYLIPAGRRRYRTSGQMFVARTPTTSQKPEAQGPGNQPEGIGPQVRLFAAGKRCEVVNDPPRVTQVENIGYHPRTRDMSLQALRSLNCTPLLRLRSFCVCG